MDRTWKELSRKERVRRLQREAILEAAEEVFAAKGYHEAKMEDIASLAEFATGSLYNYFPSKDKIFEAMFVRRINDLYDQLVEAMERETDFLSLLRSMAVVHVAFMDEHRAFFEIFASLGRKNGMAAPSHLAEQFCEQYARYERLVEHVLGIGISQGLLRDLNLRTMAVILTAVLDAAIFQWIQEHPDSSFAERYPEILDILFFGLSSKRPDEVPGEFWNPELLRNQAASLRRRQEGGRGKHHGPSTLHDALLETDDFRSSQGASSDDRGDRLEKTRDERATASDKHSEKPGSTR